MGCMELTLAGKPKNKAVLVKYIIIVYSHLIKLTGDEETQLLCRAINFA
jgi:hypothetical protein